MITFKFHSNGIIVGIEKIRENLAKAIAFRLMHMITTKIAHLTDEIQIKDEEPIIVVDLNDGSVSISNTSEELKIKITEALK